MSDEPDVQSSYGGERAVFWAWLAVIAGGLAYMIAIPLMGR